MGLTTDMLLKFKGADGSMGLRTGQIYRVEARVSWLSKKVLMTLPVRCPYDSQEAFWRNWEVIRV